MTDTPRLEWFLAQLLRTGTTLACTLISVGVVLQATGRSGAVTVPLLDRNVELVTLGIACFILLPVGGVISMVIAYAVRRDLALAGIALTVLTIIGLGLLAGLATN